MFWVGQKVARIRTTPESEYWGVRKDMTFTVSSFCDIHPHLGIFLCEVATAPHAGRCACWNKYGFRPIVERKTDISVFRRLLTPSPARSRELCGND